MTKIMMQFYFFRNGLKVHMQSLNMKDYDIFDFYFYGSKGKILFTGIGRTANVYNIIKSPEHTNFTELNTKSIKIFGDNPQKQFKTLSENAIECLLNKKKVPFCTAEDSFIDMKIIEAIKKVPIIIQKLLILNESPFNRWGGIHRFCFK